MHTVDWNRTVFVLITPDALARHLALPIVDRIIEQGFVPIRHQLVWAGSAQLDALYQINIAQVWDTYRYRLVDMLIKFGPCLALLFEDQAGGGDAHARMRQIKGDSHPYKAERGTIRRDLRGINSVLGLLHSSDSPTDAEYEHAIFLPAEPAAPPAPAEHIHALRQHCAVLSLQRPAERREFSDVLIGLRAKILTAVWDELSPHARTLLDEWQRDGWAALAQPGVGQQLVQQLRSGSTHPLAALLACEFQPEYPAIELDRLWARLAAYGIAADAWEELVLTTSMHFKPSLPAPEERPASRADAYARSV